MEYRRIDAFSTVMIPKIKFRFSINKNKIDLKIFDICEYTSWDRILVSLNSGIVGFLLIFNRSIPLISRSKVALTSLSDSNDASLAKSYTGYLDSSIYIRLTRVISSNDARIIS